MFPKVPLPCRMSRTQIGSWKHLGVFDERLEGAVVQALLGRLRGAHILVSFCFIFASIANRELRVLLDRVFWPAEGRSECKLEWFMRRQHLMEPDFLSEILLLVIGAVMSFFLIWTGVIALLRR